ncbi:hypothetical protein B0H12DRAFT_1235708 [Mycena haematopus]|nr:hypothetical protein B0H12DRAFT_1235708 [Mycena haematopus]
MGLRKLALPPKPVMPPKMPPKLSYWLETVANAAAAALSIGSALTFRKDGSLKITDLHFGENSDDGIGVGKDRNTTRLMRAILLFSAETSSRVFNGDLITGDYTFHEDSTLLIDQIVAPLIEGQIPFFSTHGIYETLTDAAPSLILW